MNGYGGSTNNVLTISVMGNTKLVNGGGAQNESVFSKLKKEILSEKIVDDEKEDWERGYVAPEGSAPSLNPADKEKAQVYLDIVGRGNQMSTTKIPDASTIINMKREMNVVNAEELSELIKRLGYQLKFRETESDFVPSILVFGLPGQGKTWICEKLADDLKMNFKGIEVAAFYTEVFGGMPTADEYVTWEDENGVEVSPTSAWDSEEKGSAKAEAGAAESTAPADKPKRGRPAGTKNKVKTEDLIRAGMVIEHLASGEEIIGYQYDIDLAKRKYGLVQQKLMGTLPLSESKSNELDLQAYILRKKLSGNPIPKSILESAEFAKYNAILEEGKVQVTRRTLKLKAIEGVLPPSGDKSPWLVLLDEFNRGKQQMNAVMNLLLTGSIGTIYKLPLKTIVAVSGNIGGSLKDSQGDGEEVQALTTAMLTRLNMVVKYQLSNAEAGRFQSRNVSPVKTKSYAKDDWATDAEKEQLKKGVTVMKYKEKDAKGFHASEEEKKLISQSRAPSAWVNYTTAYETFKNGQAYKPVTTESFQPGRIVPINPRFIERISQTIVIAAVQDWMNNDLVGNKPKEWYEENYKNETFPYYDEKEKDWESAWKVSKDMISPINLYIQRNQLHPRYLKLINSGLMAKGYDLLANLVKSAADTQRVSKIGDVEHIMLSHTNDHDENSKSPELLAKFIEVCQTAKTAILNQIPKKLAEIGTISRFEELLSSNEVKYDKKEFPSAYAWLASNIIMFMLNSDAGDEEVFGFAVKMCALAASDAVVNDEDKKEFVYTLMRGHLGEYNETMKTQFKNMSSLTMGQEMEFDNSESAASIFTGKKSKNESMFLSILASELLTEEVGNSTKMARMKYKFGAGVEKYIKVKFQTLWDSPQRGLVSKKIDSIVAEGKQNVMQVAFEAIAWARSQKILKDDDKKGKD